MKWNTTASLMLIFFVLFTVLATAPPSIPANIFGTVKLPNGSAVGAGINVTTYVQGVYRNMTITLSNGQYQATLNTTDYNEGDNATLYVNQSDWYGTVEVLSLTTGANVASDLNLVDQVAPTAPSGVTAVEQSIGIVNLTWSAATDGAGVQLYTIYRDTSSGFTATVSKMIGVSFTLNFSDTVTPDATTYYYLVKANDTANMGPVSNEASVTVSDTVPPAAPTGLAVSNTPGEEGYLNLSWNANGESDFNNYIVFSSADGTNYNPDSTTTNTYYVDTGLTDGQTYYYRISANDTSGNPSANSTAQSAVPLDNKAPNAAYGMTVMDVSDAEKLVNVTFEVSTSPDTAGYFVYKDDVFLKNLTGSANSSFLDVVVADSVNYTYKVSAYDEVANFAINTTQSGSSIDDLSPEQVTISDSFAENRTINVTWNAVTQNTDSSALSDLAGYHVYMNESGSFSLAATLGSTVLSYENTTLTNGIVYGIKVAAFDDDGNEGPNSTIVYETPSERPSFSMDVSDGSIIRSSVIFNITVSSVQTLDTVFYNVKRDTGVVADAGQLNASVGVNTWNYTIDPSGWQEGTAHYVFAWANDTNDQYNVINYTITTDDTNPSVFAASVNESFAKSTQSVSVVVNVTDQNLLSVYANGVSLAQIDERWGAYTNGTALCPGVTDATCTITFTATDSAGNVNDTETVSYEIDDVAPVGSSPAIDDGDSKVRPTDDINFSITAIDADTSIASVTLNGTILTQTGTSWWTVNTTSELCPSITDGLCGLDFIITDAAGNTDTTQSISFTVDGVSPSVSLFSGNASIVMSDANVNITVTVSDNDDVASVIVNGSSLIEGAANVWSTVNTTADFGCTSDGTCVLTAVAYDSVNNTNSSVTLILTVDETNPALTGGDIDDSDNIIRSDVNVNFTVTVIETNPSAVTLNGTSMTQSGTTWSLYTTADTFCPSVNDGACILTFIATDIAGNVNDTETLTATIDNVFPSVTSITTNASGGILPPSESLNVSAVITDTNLFSVTINGTVMNQGSGNIWSTVNTTDELCGSVDGSCVLTVVATDRAGNINNTGQLTLTVDTVPPTTEPLYISEDDRIVNSTQNFNVNVTVTDSNDVFSVNISADGGNSYELTRNGNLFSGTVNATYLNCGGEGPCTLRVIAIDNATNTNSSRIEQIVVDDTEPVFNSAVLSDDYVQNSTSVLVTVNVSDVWAYPVTVYAEGTNLSYLGNDIYNGTITLLDKVSDVVNITMTDAAGNTGTDTSTSYTVDDVAPVVASSTLSDSYVRTGQIVEATVDITEAQLTTVTINGNTMINTAGSIWKYNLTMPAVSTNFTVVATDDAGNSVTYTDFPVEVDNIRPAFTFRTPLNGSSYVNAEGNLTFNFTVTEVNLTSVNLTIDYGKRRYGNASAGLHEVTLTNFKAGSHTVLFSAIDEAGNTRSSRLRFVMVRVLNMTEVTNGLNDSLGSDSRRINFSSGGNDVSFNETFDANVSMELEIELNVSGDEVIVNVPSFNGLDAEWGSNFSVDTNETSSKAVTVEAKAGSDVARIVIFENMSTFLDEDAFDYVTLVFNRSLDDMDVFFIEDDHGATIHKLSVCSSVPSTVASADAACFMNTSANITVFLPHFSGAALTNDTLAPIVGFSSPVNGSTLADSYFTLSGSIVESNPDSPFCDYSLAGVTSGSLTTTQVTDTNYSFSNAFSAVLDGDYNLTINCADQKGQVTNSTISFTVADTTIPNITASGPSSTQSTSDTSITATLTATTNENAVCKYSTSNVSYATMTTTLSGSALSHTKAISFSSDGIRTYYVSCNDTAGNVMPVATQIQFTVNVGSGDDGGSSSSSSSSSTDVEEYENTPIYRELLSWYFMSSNSTYEMVIDNPDMSFKELEFSLKEDRGYFRIIVETHTTRPDDLPSPISEQYDKVYEFIEVDPSAMIDYDSAVIRFGVDKDWFTANQVTADRVRLLRYTAQGWTELSSSYLGEEGDYHLFEASTPGFSYFAVVMVPKSPEPVNPDDMSEQPTKKGELPVPTVEVIDEPENVPDIPKPVAEKKSGVGSVILFILTVFILAAILLFTKYRGKIDGFMHTLKLRNAKEKLKETVSRARMDGYTNTQISKMLFEKGWDHETVNEVLKRK